MTEIDRALVKAAIARRLFAEVPAPVRLGRFHIVRRIGDGAMGTVYEADDVERCGKIALKVLRRFDAPAIDALKSEFRSLCDVLHPNLVVLHELFIEPPHLYFTMELVQGVRFNAWVREGGTFSETRLRAALPQLAQAVNAIHAAGKLHQDLKPNNIMVTAEGRVVVLDFGLVEELPDAESPVASRMHGVASTGALSQGLGVVARPDKLRGTPAYMAPERIRGGSASEATDWYAVGVILFQALAGRLPVDSAPLEVLADKYEQAAPHPASISDRKIPADLRRLCGALLERDTERRASAGRLLALGPEVLDGAKSPAIPWRLPTVFVGRMLEFSVLRQKLERTAAGAFATQWISGASGIGKSALLDRFAESAMQEALVLRGRCRERESVPYNVLDGPIDALARHLRRLPHEEVSTLVPQHTAPLLRQFPVLEQVRTLAEAAAVQTDVVDAVEQRKLAFTALHELLRALSERTVIVMIVDDLQWGDLDSARLLDALLGPPDPAPLLFIGAYRSEEIDSSAFLRETLQRRVPHGGWMPECLTLGPLSADEATDLVCDLMPQFGAGVRGMALAIAREAEGVPFFVCQLAEYMCRVDAATTEQAHRPRLTMEQMILARVAQLSEIQQRLLQVLSIAAAPLEPAVVVDAAGYPRDGLEALAALRAARLVRFRRDVRQNFAEVYHDKIGKSVSARLTPDAARGAHSAIARALERRGVIDPERLIVPYLGAGEHERAGHVAVAAAHAAASKFAFNHAAGLFEQAIELLPPQARHGLSLHRFLGDALANAGRGAGAARAYLKAAELASPAASAVLRRLAAQQYFRSGRIDEGTQLVRGVLQEVGLRYPADGRGLLARAVWHRLLARLSVKRGKRSKRTAEPMVARRLDTLAGIHQEIAIEDPLRGVILTAQLLRHAVCMGDPLHVLRAEVWDLLFISFLGGRRNEQSVARRLHKLASLRDDVGTPYAHALYDMALASAYLYSGRFAAVREPSSRAERIFQSVCPGSSLETSYVTALRHGALEFCGDMRELRREAPERIRDAAERDDHLTSKLFVLSMTHSLLAEGAPEAALAYLDDRRRELGATWSVTTPQIVHRTAEALLYRAHDRGAIDYVMSHWSAIRRTGAYHSAFFKAYAHCMRLRCALAGYVATGDSKLRTMVEQDIRLVSRLPALAGFATGLHGTLAFHLGDVELARRLSRKALHQFEAHQMDRCVAYVRLRLGELTPGEEGARVFALAEAELAGQVHDPQRWVSFMLGALHA